MAGPSVDELLRAGGKRRAPPKVGSGETFLNRAVNALPAGKPVVDALSTAVLQGAKALGVGESGVEFTPKAQAELRARGVDTGPESTIPGVVDTYRQARDTRAERTEAGSEQNPWAASGGALTGFGLSLLAPLPKAPGSGVGSTVATGVGYGALGGLTEGGADLTRGEVGQALEDTLEGAAWGGAAGAAGHGLMRLGQRGVQALKGARGQVLEQETLAAREAAEAGQQALAREVDEHRALVGKAREMMGKEFAGREARQAKQSAQLEREHGLALESNKARDARSAREAAKSEDQNLKLLGQARELNKKYDSGRAKELERQIAEAERAAEAERKMVGQAREMDKKLTSRERDMMGRAREMNKSRDAQDRDMVGAAREMNKRLDEKGLARARKVLDRAKAKNEDPNTTVLEGMYGKAHQAQQSRTDKALQYQREMGDPDLNTRIASSRQNYIDRMPEAVDNPDGAVRLYMEKYLRNRYPDDPGRVARIMRERVGPAGEVRPRVSPSTSPSATERMAGEYTIPLSELDDVPAKAWDAGRARSIRKAIQQGKELPPIQLGQGDDGLREIMDGNHRLAIYREMGLPQARVRFMSDEAARVQARQRGTSPFEDAAAPMDSRGPSLADEAEAAMAARRGEMGPSSAQGEAPLVPPREPTVSTRPMDAAWERGATLPAQPGLLQPLPARRPGNNMLDYGGNRGEDFSRAQTAGGLGELARSPDEALAMRRSAAASAQAGAGTPPTRNARPRSMPQPAMDEATRATQVPEVRRPLALPAPQQAPPPAPVADDIQEVTRLAGPEDVAPLASERASAREAGAFGAVARAGYEGVRSGNSILGSVVGGLAGVTRESLQDPAVKARVLSSAKVQLLANINPEVFAKVGHHLAQAATSGEGQYKAIRYVHARRDPVFREAEAKAAEQAAQMSDEQLMQLIASP